MGGDCPPPFRNPKYATGLESSKTVRWADRPMQRKIVPIIKVMVMLV